MPFPPPPSYDELARELGRKRIENNNLRALIAAHRAVTTAEHNAYGCGRHDCPELAARLPEGDVLI